MKKWFTFWKVIGYSLIFTIVYGIALDTTREEAYLLGQSWTVLVVVVIVCKYTFWKLAKGIYAGIKHKGVN